MRKFNSRTIREAIELDQTPNLSYFPRAISDKLKQSLAGIKGIKTAEDELAVYALAKKGTPRGPQIIVDTHLDHPGFVVDQTGKAVEIGSMHNSRVNPIDISLKQPVALYTGTGDKLDDGYLSNFAPKKRMSAAISAKTVREIPMNTQVLPNIRVGSVDSSLMMRSVDNIATVQICLELLRTLENAVDINVLVIFSKIEEVAQITATGIALRGRTPFGRLDTNSPIYVLEAAPMFPQEKNKVIIGLSKTENGITFEEVSTCNRAMETAREVAKKMRVEIIETDLPSNTDGISYLLIGGFNNVATLHINSQNRHNVDDEGKFAPEITTIKSIETLLELMLTIIKGNQQDSRTSRSQKRILNTQEKLKRRSLISAYYWAQPRLKQEHLYPETLSEMIACALGSLKSRFWVYP